MQSVRAEFETVRTVKTMPNLVIDAEDLQIMAMFVVLKMIQEDATNLVLPKKIKMIKELREVLTGSIEVKTYSDWNEAPGRVGLKEAKDAVDNVLFRLGIQ